MKALHIMYVCGTRGTGGAAGAATRLHLRMLDQGVDSRVVCVWNGMYDEECGVNNCWTRWWWFWSCVLHKLTGQWTHALDLPGFDRFLAAFRPDEVHVHWIRRDTISWRQLRRIGAGEWRVYVHLHDLWPLEQKQITSLNPTFVAYSDWVCHCVKNLGYRVERRELLLDPVYTNPSSPQAIKPSHPTSKIILFGCKDGRQNPDKGFSDLEKALALLPADVQKGIELRIFGEDGAQAHGEMRHDVRTVLLGRIDDPRRLREEYRKASCFAFPSLHETMGMTKLEALACGCPVVAFDREACAEGIVHGKTGYVARDGDIADFAAGLMAWVVGSR